MTIPEGDKRWAILHAALRARAGSVPEALREDFVKHVADIVDDEDVQSMAACDLNSESKFVVKLRPFIDGAVAEAYLGLACGGRADDEVLAWFNDYTRSVDGTDRQGRSLRPEFMDEMARVLVAFTRTISCV